MRILIDLTSIYNKLTGIEKFALNITKHMLQQDYTNEYIIIFRKEIHKDFQFINQRENIKYKIIRYENQLLVDQIVMPFYLYRNKSDAYVFLAFPSPVLFFSNNLINTIHDMTPWLYPKTMTAKGRLYFKLLIRLAIIKSKIILTVSNSSKKDIQSFFGVNNLEIVNNGVDNNYNIAFIERSLKAEIFNKYNLPDEYILCIGTLEPRKNLGLLIDAYIDLKKNNVIQHSLVISGRFGWKYEDIINKVKKNNLEKDIVFTGFIEEKHLPYVYYYADCFIFPSMYEGFGIPPLEAMAMGVPVISSNSSSLPEVLGEKEIFFSNNEIDDLKNKIMMFINMRTDDKEFIKNYGIERAKMFRWENESRKLLSILNKHFQGE